MSTKPTPRKLTIQRIARAVVTDANVNTNLSIEAITNVLQIAFKSVSIWSVFDDGAVLDLGNGHDMVIDVRKIADEVAA